LPDAAGAPSDIFIGKTIGSDADRGDIDPIDGFIIGLVLERLR